MDDQINVTDPFNYTGEQLLTASFNSSESVRFIVTEDGTILHFNRKAYENGQILHNKILKRGDNLFDYANDPGKDVVNELKACINRSFAGETFYSESEIKFESGVMWIKSEYVPIFDKLKIIATSIHIHDITKQKLEQLAKERLLTEIKSLNESRMAESKALIDLVIKYAKNGIKSVNNNQTVELKKSLLDLIGSASELRKRIIRWKKF